MGTCKQPASSADVCTPGEVALPLDSRAAQCERAADYMHANPGCTLRDLASGADLGSASKVVSEMIRPQFGYDVRGEWDREPCAGGTRSRPVKRYFLQGRPMLAQRDLFTE